MAITLAQDAVVNGNVGSTLTITPSSNTSIGNLVVLVVCWQSAGTTLSSVKDNDTGSDTYAIDRNDKDAGGARNVAITSFVQTSSRIALKVTFSGSVTASAEYYEFAPDGSSAFTAPYVDGAGQTAQPSATAAWAVGNWTVTGGSAIVAGGRGGSSQTYSAGTGNEGAYSLPTNKFTSAGQNYTEYLVSATGTATATTPITLGGTSTGVWSAFAYKQTATGGSGDVPHLLGMLGVGV